MKVHIYFLAFFLMGKTCFGLTCSALLIKTNTDTLRISSFNLGDFLLEGNRESKIKPEHQVEGTARAIKHINPDFLIVNEILSHESLKIFIADYLNEQYSFAIPQRSNSGRQIALLYRKDLPVNIEIQSHDREKVINPFTKKREPAFVQNFPIFIIKNRKQGRPVLALAGVHLKSKRDRAFDKDSNTKRAQEVDSVVDITDEFLESFPETPIIILGDFNSARADNELEDLTDLGFVDPFDENFEDPFEMGLKTHIFFESRRPPVLTSPDRAFVESNFAKNIIKARVHRFRDRNGQIKPYPKSHKQRSRNPSDHYPIYFDLEGLKLF